MTRFEMVQGGGMMLEKGDWFGQICLLMDPTISATRRKLNKTSGAGGGGKFWTVPAMGDASSRNRGRRGGEGGGGNMTFGARRGDRRGR